MTDGTSLIRAQAYDRYGQTGSGYVVTVLLNRFAPAAPTGVVGGRNPAWGSNVVELEWNPSPERDVTGYQVWRVTGGSVNLANDVKVCTTQVDRCRRDLVHRHERADRQPALLRARGRAGAAARHRDRDQRAAGVRVDAAVRHRQPARRRRRRRSRRPRCPAAACSLTLDRRDRPRPDADPLLPRSTATTARPSPAAGTPPSSGAVIGWTDTAPNAAAHTYWVIGGRRPPRRIARPRPTGGSSREAGPPRRSRLHAGRAADRHDA